MNRYISILIFLFFPIIIFSQKKISATYENEPLQKVLLSLERNYKIVFSYTSEVIENQVITSNVDDLILEKALTGILGNTTVDFEIINETYVVLRSREPNTSELFICGRIIDTNETPLSFANIFIKKNNQGTSANENGIFEWQGKINATDTILISYVGFQSKKIIAADLEKCPTITLQLQKSFFSEVLVKEYVISGIEQSESLNHLVLRPKEMEVVPGLTEADVLQMVQILPGVQSPDESATGLHIRGGTPDQNLILWDGIPIYNSGHFFGMLSAFNPYIVDNVKVYRGSFGAEYGGRVAGVIDISSENKIPKKVKADVGINFTHADASIAIPFFQNKSALILSARRAYTDVIETPTYQKLSSRVFQKGKINEQLNIVEEEDEDLDLNLNFIFNDLNAKWLFQPNAKNDFAISAFGIFDKLEFLSLNQEEDLSEEDNLNLDNIGWSGHWNRKWKRNLSSQAKISYTDLQNDYRFRLGVIDDSLDVELDRLQLNEVTDLTFQLNNNWRFSKNLKLNFGYQFSDLIVGRKIKWSEEDEIEELVDTTQVHTMYFTLSPNFKDKWKFDLGTRFSYDQLTQTRFLEPRFSLFYIPNKKWQFKFSSGIYQQFVSQVVELNDLGFNEQLWVLASEDEDFPIVKNKSLSAGILFHRPDFQIEVEGYFKKLAGLTSVSPAFINSNSVQDIFNVGEGEVLGLDVLIRKRWSNYQTWLSYTYNQVQYNFEEINLGQDFSAPHERPHSFTSVHLLKYRNWQFSASWKYASGKVYTKATGIGFEDDDAFPIYSEDEINASRLPNYHRLDASILYKILPKNKSMEGMIGLSFLNIYNRRNLLSRQYSVEEDEDTQENELIVLDRPLLGFTPNVVFRWAWK